MSTNGEYIFKRSGKKKGKTVTIFGGVHGNEPCGVEAIKNIRDSLEIERGKVFYIFGNPRAIEVNVRGIDMDLNRAFRPDKEMSKKELRSYEYKRSREIMPYIDESDAMLDLHSSSSKDTERFAICESNSFTIAQKLPLPIISSGWDSLEPGGTDYYANKIGIPGICVECGNNNDPKSISFAEETIRTFLSVLGLISCSLPKFPTERRTINVHTVYHTKHGFIPARDFADFEPLSKGTLIGHDGDEEVFMREDGVIIFCRECSGSEEEAFLLGKEKGSEVDKV